MEEIARHCKTDLASRKETVVRIKRKRDDVPFESVWLEVMARPIKRHEPNITELSLVGATTKIASDEGVSCKLLFRRVETLSPSGVKELTLPEFLLKVKDRKRSQEKQQQRHTRNFKDKQGQHLAAAKEQHQAHSRTARFEQVWQSRRRERRVAEKDDPMQEIFHLYDVVRVEVNPESAARTERRKQARREAGMRRDQLLCNYLPLLREILPSAAAEIEALPSGPSQTEVGGQLSSNSTDYVYDVYTLDEEMESKLSNSTYPIIQIMDDEHYDGGKLSDTDYDGEDSNDENNPNNDYPEEEDEYAADDDSNSDFSYDVNPYSVDNEEYDTVFSDDERNVWRPRR